MSKRYEDRYGRGGYRRDRDRDRDYADDRGYMERAGEQVRSWFGDDDPQRHRSMDEYRDREHEPRYGSSWNRGSWDRSDRGGSNAPGRWVRGPEDWRAAESREPMRYQGAGNTWPGGGWNRDRDQDNWREREARQWEQGGRYGEAERYGRSERQGSNWSVDEGRTEFGQQHYRGRGPKGYQRSDQRILEDVCDRLMYSDVDAGDIEVKVENGEVTLSGTVRDRSDKRRAEDVAEEVAGVRDVHNNIRVSRGDRGIGQSETSMSDQPGTVLGVNPTESSAIANARPKAKS